MSDKNEIAVSVFNSLAQSYADKYMDVSQYLPSINTLTKRLALESKVLELGCGPGNLTKQLHLLRPDLKITATDLAPEMLYIAKNNNPSIETLKLDCRNVNSLKQKFDCVVIGFVLPYLNQKEVEQLLSDTFHVLNTNGCLYLSTIMGNPKTSDWKKGSNTNTPSIYMNYYSKNQIEKWLTRNHFSISNTQVLNITNADEKDLVVVAVKT